MPLPMIGLQYHLRIIFNVKAMPDTDQPDSNTVVDTLTRTEAETLAAFKNFLGAQQAATKTEPPPPETKRNETLWDHVCEAFRHGHAHAAPTEPKPPKPRRLGLIERVTNVFTGGVNGLPDDEN